MLLDASIPPMPELYCPSWCTDCSVDAQGFLHHRTTVDVSGGSVQAYAGQRPGQHFDEPTFCVVTGGLDQERSAEQVRALAAGLVAFVDGITGPAVS